MAYGENSSFRGYNVILGKLSSLGILRMRITLSFLTLVCSMHYPSLLYFKAKEYFIYFWMLLHIWLCQSIIYTFLQKMCFSAHCQLVKITIWSCSKQLFLLFQSSSPPIHSESHSSHTSKAFASRSKEAKYCTFFLRKKLTRIYSTLLHT